jgi:nucleotidyltransferase/DNA polymerase involved in DNA repair
LCTTLSGNNKTEIRRACALQYNPNGDLSTLKPNENRIFNTSNGSLIAVSYEARANGVKRCDLDAANRLEHPVLRSACPGLNLA